MVKQLTFPKPVNTILASRLIKEVLGGRPFSVREDGGRTIVSTDSDFTDLEVEAITVIVRSLDFSIGGGKPKNRSPLDSDAPERFLPKVF